MILAQTWINPELLEAVDQLGPVFFTLFVLLMLFALNSRTNDKLRIMEAKRKESDQNQHDEREKMRQQHDQDMEKALTKQAEDLRRQLTDVFTITIDDLRKREKTLSDKVVSLERINDERDKEIAMLRKQIAQTIDDLQDNQRAIEAKDNELNKIIAERDSIAARSRELEAVNKRLEDANKGLQNRVANLEMIMAELQRQITDLQKQKPNGDDDPPPTPAAAEVQEPTVTDADGAKHDAIVKDDAA